jgi:hypothetical protein
MQALIAWGLLFLLYRKISAWFFVKLAVGAILIILVFGAIGDARMKSMGMDPSHTILVIGEATSEYPVDEIGTGPFWIYLYLTSPLANWQLNVSMQSHSDSDWWSFFVIQIMPDFIGKHFLGDSVIKTSPNLITSALTVSTAYGRAYYTNGWLGAALMYVVFILNYFISRFVFRRSEYFFSGMAVLSAASTLMIFENMLAFTGIVGPLLVATAFRFLLRKKVNLKARVRSNMSGELQN